MSSSSLEWNNTQSASPLTKEKKEMLSFIPLQIKRNAYFGKTLLGSCSLLERRWEKKEFNWEELYEEFSTEFWLKPELPFTTQVVKEPSRSRILRRTQPSKIPRHSAPKSISSPAKSSGSSPAETPSTVETPNISRPVTPTIPSFSQSANVINVTINNNHSGADAVDSDERQD
ncbi:uncharacterized protein OCT59_015749 [Rhizophagus irregularis]|uniref:uncharacterized protein n=1 Tax=Rhizophagus irregularis TaxID=588596 RepID=UPI00332F9D10|nr:hypothetical protein OCT59_015749 [Rhizophagus irregularis]